MMLDRIYREQQARWPSAVQTLLVEILERVEILEMTFAKLIPGMQALAGDIRAIRSGGAPPRAGGAAAPGAPLPAEKEPPAESDDTRLGANGERLTPEEESRERAMDAAIQHGNPPSP